MFYFWILYDSEENVFGSSFVDCLYIVLFHGTCRYTDELGGFQVLGLLYLGLVLLVLELGDYQMPFVIVS